MKAERCKPTVTDQPTMPEVQSNQSWIDFSDLMRFLSDGIVGECRSKPSSGSTH
jgi:hypothetical protein